jgi:50S ribosomal protein L16 3-hydroxylase
MIFSTGKHASVLGALSPKDFLARHWHKKPLLVRQAVPEFLGFVTPGEIRKLATHPEVQSRLVVRQGRRWEVHHGPFRPIDFKGLPERNWTLLVQELNHWIPEADALLNEFNFAPHARLDDLMVSYAVPGGGVGPHFDSYDVFLLQGFGDRRWAIAETDDLELRPNLDLKILKRFKPQATWDLEAGDMLYLPPHCAHDGVALTECFTYSIGFRAPSHQEWVNALLDYLQDHLVVPGRYADPDLTLQKHPAEISGAMLDKIAAIFQAVRWNEAQVLDCVGRYLSEPKYHVFFNAPEAPLTRTAFSQLIQAHGIRLDPRTRMLFGGNLLFINGETIEARGPTRKTLVELADRRSLAPLKPGAELRDILYPWYRAGWLA